jgi:hypothetical protein
MTVTEVQPLQATQLAEQVVGWLETGDLPPNLFAPDIFTDISMPTWRLQAGDVEGVLAIRREGHATPGQVVRHRIDPTPTGFVLEFEEHWHTGADCWYAREMIRADVADGRIVQMSVYCTGDWDQARQAEHAAAVTLLRP